MATNRHSIFQSVLYCVFSVVLPLPIILFVIFNQYFHWIGNNSQILYTIVALLPLFATLIVSILRICFPNSILRFYHKNKTFLWIIIRQIVAGTLPLAILISVIVLSKKEYIQLSSPYLEFAFILLLGFAWKTIYSLSSVFRWFSKWTWHRVLSILDKKRQINNDADIILPSSFYYKIDKALLKNSETLKKRGINVIQLREAICIVLRDFIIDWGNFYFYDSKCSNLSKRDAIYRLISPIEIVRNSSGRIVSCETQSIYKLISEDSQAALQQMLSFNAEIQNINPTQNPYYNLSIVSDVIKEVINDYAHRE